MKKELRYREHARAKLLSGINQLSDAVKVSLGPRGRNVVIETQYNTPTSTKDGVSIADSINLIDPVEHMGCMMIKQVAIKTVRQCGDGTTSSTILAQALAQGGVKALSKGANPMDLKRGIDKAVAEVIKYVQSQSEPVKEDMNKILQVATIASNGDTEIGGLIADAMKQVTSEGVIVLEESRTAESTVTVSAGMEFDQGFIAADFMNNNRGECEFLNPYILITDRRVNSIKEILTILEVTEKQSRPLVIISNDMDHTTINALIMNKVRASMPICVVKCPGYGQGRIDMLTDIATLTGGEFISSDIGVKLENVIIGGRKDGQVLNPSCERLGTCERIVITQNSTTIIKGAGTPESIENRVGVIKSQIAVSESDFEKEQLQGRIAKLKYGVAIIRIGATTELEMKEKKDRVDDALGATKAAVAEGIVAGGGTMYIKALSALRKLEGANKDEQTGIQLVYNAIQRPLWQIADNAGKNANEVVNQLKDIHGVPDKTFTNWLRRLFDTPISFGGDYGYNARTDRFEDLKQAGVIDPTKVVRVSLENSASIAAMFLTTEAVITNVPE